MSKIENPGVSEKVILPKGYDQERFIKNIICKKKFRINEMKLLK